MSQIRIPDLSLSGSDLFDDSEGFLEDLSDQQCLRLYGGSSLISQVSVSVGLLVIDGQPTVANVAPISSSASTSESNAGIFLL